MPVVNLAVAVVALATVPVAVPGAAVRVEVSGVGVRVVEAFSGTLSVTCVLCVKPVPGVKTAVWP